MEISVQKYSAQGKFFFFSLPIGISGLVASSRTDLPDPILHPNAQLWRFSFDLSSASNLSKNNEPSRRTSGLAYEYDKNKQKKKIFSRADRSSTTLHKPIKKAPSTYPRHSPIGQTIPFPPLSSCTAASPGPADDGGHKRLEGKGRSRRKSSEWAALGKRRKNP